MRVVGLCVLFLLSCGDEPSDDIGRLRQGLDQVASFGSNPGNLLMYRLIPAGLPANRPVIVLLHGCGDTASNFATTSGLEALATSRQFALVVPQQQYLNNFQTCFNWFDSANQSRGAGEMASIEQMVDKTITDAQSDSTMLFVVGFSAGGAEAANVLATSASRYRAGVISAGIPFKCAETLNAGFACMGGSVDLMPADWAQKVRTAAMPYTGPWPRIAIWQGLNDGTVATSNRLELVEQWTALQGIDQTADGTQPIASGGTRTFFKTASGSSVVELNEVPNVGHAFRSAWAGEIVDFLFAAGATGGGAAGGASGGSTAGGSVAGGSAGGTSTAGGTVGGGSAGGSAGGVAAAGGSSGGAPSAGGTNGGGTAGGSTTPVTGCQGCSSSSAIVLVPLVFFRRQRGKTTRTSQPEPAH